MSPVEPCSTSDVPEVARLHAKAFLGSPEHSSPGLERYYRETFFEHPWVDPRITPLISRDKGRIAGFLGVIPRTMRLDGEPITVAVIHRGMVDPDLATPFTARAIFREMLDGPQELSVSDACNPEARKVWESLGGEVVIASSIDWFMPLRPGSYAGLLLGSRRRLRPFLKLARPAFAVGDLLADAMGRSAGALETSIEFEEVTDERFLEVLCDLTSKRPLVSEYTQDSWLWLMGRLRENESRGRFEARLATDSGGRVHAACAWYVRPDRTMEILLLATRPSRTEAVYRGVFRKAWEGGLTRVTARADREFMKSSWGRKSRLESRLWTVMHSRDQRFSQLFHRGDVMFSGLDFELWLRSPQDPL